MTLQDESGTTYETIWRELVDLYPFIPDPDEEKELMPKGQLSKGAEA
jgi:hypothetical protein